MSTNGTVKSIVRLIDVADHGKVNYLEGCLQAAPALLGAEYGALKAFVTEALAQRVNSPMSAKTLCNDLVAARHLVIKFGGADAAGVAINKRNNDARRASYSPQVLQQEMAPSEVRKPQASKRPHVVVSVSPEATLDELDRVIAELKALRAAKAKKG